MNRLIIIALQIPLFILGIACGNAISNIEWYDTPVNNIARCSVYDDRKLCNAKIKLNEAIEELNNAYTHK